jgi:hypothetical protein
MMRAIHPHIAHDIGHLLRIIQALSITVKSDDAFFLMAVIKIQG